jgi:8-hydroxy-5-deazaflavin:NADPH oxidoreductase
MTTIGVIGRWAHRAEFLAGGDRQRIRDRDRQQQRTRDACRAGGGAGPAGSGRRRCRSCGGGGLCRPGDPAVGRGRLPIEPLAGEVALTTCNYFAERDGPIAEIDSGGLTVPQYLQARLPTSKLVRAFNHLDAAAIASDGTPPGTPNRRALGYAGDDPGAKKLAADLYDEFGFDAVDIGGLADAWRLDVDQPTFVVFQNAHELKANLAKATRHLS